MSSTTPRGSLTYLGHSFKESGLGIPSLSQSQRPNSDSSRTRRFFLRRRRRGIVMQRMNPILQRLAKLLTDGHLSTDVYVTTCANLVYACNDERAPPIMQPVPPTLTLTPYISTSASAPVDSSPTSHVAPSLPKTPQSRLGARDPNAGSMTQQLSYVTATRRNQATVAANSAKTTSAITTPSRTRAVIGPAKTTASLTKEFDSDDQQMQPSISTAMTDDELTTAVTNQIARAKADLQQNRDKSAMKKAMKQIEIDGDSISHDIRVVLLRNTFNNGNRRYGTRTEGHIAPAAPTMTVTITLCRELRIDELKQIALADLREASRHVNRSKKQKYAVHIKPLEAAQLDDVVFMEPPTTTVPSRTGTTTVTSTATTVTSTATKTTGQTTTSASETTESDLATETTPSYLRRGRRKQVLWTKAPQRDPADYTALGIKMIGLYLPHYNKHIDLALKTKRAKKKKTKTVSRDEGTAKPHDHDFDFTVDDSNSTAGGRASNDAVSDDVSLIDVDKDIYDDEDADVLQDDDEDEDDDGDDDDGDDDELGDGPVSDVNRLSVSEVGDDGVDSNDEVSPLRSPPTDIDLYGNDDDDVDEFEAKYDVHLPAVVPDVVVAAAAVATEATTPEATNDRPVTTRMATRSKRPAEKTEDVTTTRSKKPRPE